MNLSGVVAVSGKPGLFKVLGQNKAGFLLQGLEGDGAKVMVSNNARLAALDETTVYGVDEDLMLKDILLKIQSSKDLTIPEPKAEAHVLREFFIEICPDHDQERVYPSDLKKIISWYRIIEKLPIFDEADPKENEKKALEEGKVKEIEEDGEVESGKTIEGAKPAKKAISKKAKSHDHDKESAAINTKTPTRNVTHAVRKVNTGANKKAK